MPAFVFGSSGGSSNNNNSSSSNGGANGSSGSSGSSGGGGSDRIVGHCAIGLEQLCKVAMVSSGGVTGSVNITRLLVNRARPMYNIDGASLQVTNCLLHTADTYSFSNSNSHTHLRAPV